MGQIINKAYHRINDVPVCLIFPKDMILLSAVAVYCSQTEKERFFAVICAAALAWVWIVTVMGFFRGRLWIYGKKIQSLFIAPASRPCYFCIGTDIGMISSSTRANGFENACLRFMMGTTKNVGDWIKMCRIHEPKFCCVHIVTCLNNEVAASLSDKFVDELESTKIGQSALYKIGIYELEKHLQTFGCVRHPNGSWSLDAVLKKSTRDADRSSRKHQKIARMATVDNDDEDGESETSFEIKAQQ